MSWFVALPLSSNVEVVMSWSIWSATALARVEYLVTVLDVALPLLWAIGSV